MKDYYVYMFLDENEEVLYIGSSKHLAKRIRIQHFSNLNGNLNEECISETYKILYHQSLSESDMKVKERYLINKLTPKYNDKMNNRDKFSFEIPNINWILFSIDNETLIDKRKRKKTNLLINKEIDEDDYLNSLQQPIYTPYDCVFSLSLLSDYLKKTISKPDNNFEISNENYENNTITFFRVSYDDFKNKNIDYKKLKCSMNSLQLPIIQRKCNSIRDGKKIEIKYSNSLYGYCECITDGWFEFNIDNFLYKLLFEIDFNLIQFEPESLKSILNSAIKNYPNMSFEYFTPRKAKRNSKK